MRRWLCCKGSLWRRVVCALDNLNHVRLRGWFFRPLCRLHEWHTWTGKMTMNASRHESEEAERIHDEIDREYVSRRWAEDWNSPEDAVYDA